MLLRSVTARKKLGRRAHRVAVICPPRVMRRWVPRAWLVLRVLLPRALPYLSCLESSGCTPTVSQFVWIPHGRQRRAVVGALLDLGDEKDWPIDLHGDAAFELLKNKLPEQGDTPPPLRVPHPPHTHLPFARARARDKVQLFIQAALATNTVRLRSHTSLRTPLACATVYTHVHTQNGPGSISFQTCASWRQTSGPHVQTRLDSTRCWSI